MLFPQGHATRAAAFDAWAARHGKVYADAATRASRQQIFASNLRYINAANRRGRSYTLAANHLADQTPAERGMRKGRVAPSFKIRSRAAVRDVHTAATSAAITDIMSACGQCVRLFSLLFFFSFFSLDWMPHWIFRVGW